MEPASIADRRAVRSRWSSAPAALACLALAACGSGKGAATAAAPLYAVLSAMPSELAPNLVDADLLGTVAIEGRDVRLGTLEDVPVVLAMTGIGTANAAAVSGAVLDELPVTGVVVSGVAHTSLRIGDVSVADSWVAPDGAVFTADSRWLAAARALAAPGAVTLPRCSHAPPATSRTPICVDRDPSIVVGGTGRTSDPFEGAAFPCVPGGGGVFGCAPPARGARARSGSEATPSGPPVADVEVQDMETAVIAREAAARDLPFIAFRATSDSAPGTIDSLGEFFHYHGLAAETASGAARAFLERIAR